ncbi:MAG: spondin domain-containing protein [Planctomycetota bacterium]
MHARALMLLLVAGAPALAQAPDSRATYRVTFQADWSADTHPYDFPRIAHLSGLVGATHDDSIAFWRVGGLASPGIEAMAESGSKSSLESEVRIAIDDGRAGTLVSGIGTLSGEASTHEFETSAAFPLATLVAMISPSPDWFVGSQGVPLRDGAGWLDRVVVELWPMDAGTDSGVAYISPNQDTQPPMPIADIRGQLPFAGGPAMGTFTFELLAVECAADFDGDGRATIFDFLAFQNAFAAGDAAADVDGSGTLTIFDFLAFQNALSAGC